MSQALLEGSLGFLNTSQKARLRKALGRSTSRKRANEIIANLVGVSEFFVADDDWTVFRSSIAADAPDILQDTTQEYGDFQTPLDLARRVCERLFRMGYRPITLFEPTCGRGNFILAALEVFPSIRTFIGLEIQESYVNECKNRLLAKLLAQPELKKEIHIRQGNIFKDFPPPELKEHTSEQLMILGNPPWVTNATLSVLESSNLPIKSNFKGHSGLDALTGKSNFDIAEFILLQLIRNFAKSRATLAMLCKNTVVRNLVEATKTQTLPIANIHSFTFEAAKEFGVACDASLFVADTTSDLGAKTCIATHLGEGADSRVFGWVGDDFVADTIRYARARQIEGVSSSVWRQGIKHDCSNVMELTEEDHGRRNGLGALVEIEEDRVFPLAKSSDLKSPVITRLRKAVIVPQDTVGQDTKWLKQENPRLWKYLSAHAGQLAARRSVIYKDKPQFSIFGVGDYSFKPYKVAISGFYKGSEFSLLMPVNRKPVMLDDTCYLLGFDTLGQAAVALGLLNSQFVQDFLKSIVFPDSKRPYTKDILMRIDLKKVCSLVSPADIRSYLSKIEGAPLDFESSDFERFENSNPIETQAIFALERGPVYNTGHRH